MTHQWKVTYEQDDFSGEQTYTAANETEARWMAHGVSQYNDTHNVRLWKRPVGDWEEAS